MAKEPPNSPGKWKANRASLSWSAAGTETLKSTIVSITECGNAIMFSKTIDGSALICTVYSGNEKCREFVTEPGDIVPLLAWLVETYS